MAGTTNAVFAIVMVSLTPVSALCILFNFIVIVCCCRRRSIDLVASTLLLGRLGHACGLAVLLARYTLENWVWSRSTCQTFVCVWISCWLLDVLANLFFLAHNSYRLGQDKTNVGYQVFVLLVACWGLASLAGAMTFLADSMFHNYEATSRSCSLGLGASDSPILIGAMLVIIVGGLLIVVLTISLSAESRAVALRFKLLETRAECLRTAKIRNGDVTGAGSADDLELNGLGEGTGTECGHAGDRSTGRRVYTWAYVDKQMKDLRHIHAAATSTTILLNVIPQLVLYSIDIMSGTLYAYTHHILLAVGMIHSLVLPVSFCTAGIRYKETSQHLLKGIFGRSSNMAGDRDPEQNVVFHIGDVTTDSSDTNALEPPRSDVTSENKNYKRGQLQVLSLRGEPSLAPSAVNSEQQRREVASTAAGRPLSSDPDRLRGLANPGYEHDASVDPGAEAEYVRSLSDGSVDYGDGYDGEEDWSSWDSDSETWSNLYDYSDIEEVLDGGSARLSPNAAMAHARRPSHVSQTGSRGRRRKLSSQTSWPPDGQSPRAKNRERRRSEDRRRKRKSKRRRKQETKGIASGLEATMHLGIASAMMSRDIAKTDPERHYQMAEGDRREEGQDAVNYANNSPDTGSSNIPAPPPPPDMDTLLRASRSTDLQKSTVDSDDSEEDQQRQSAFASQLAAAALRLKHVSGQDKDVGHQPKIIRNESGAIPSRKTSRRSSSKLQNVAVLPDRPKAAAVARRNDSSLREAISGRANRRNSKAEARRTESKLSRRSSSSSKGGLGVIRKHSSGRTPTRASAPPIGSTARHLDPGSTSGRPVSAPNLDPALANMTLSEIIANPLLKDQLRRSLESLDSAADDGQSGGQRNSPRNGSIGDTDDFRRSSGARSRETASAAMTSSSERSEIGQTDGHRSKAAEMAYYQIPNIDSDCRYRPKKPLRRGKYAFKVAAQTIIIQDFLKKALSKPAPAPTSSVERSTSRSSWANDSDVVDV